MKSGAGDVGVISPKRGVGVRGSGVMRERLGGGEGVCNWSCESWIGTAGGELAIEAAIVAGTVLARWRECVKGDGA